MKTTAATALLLAGFAAAAPTASRQAFERRAARFAAAQRQSATFPYAVNGTAGADRISLSKNENDGAEYVSYDSNWSGASTTDTGINNVYGITNVPSVGVPPGGDGSTTYGGSVWVGIDGGDGCDVILQTGITWTVNGDGPSYSAFYEWYPAPSGTLDIEINEGDEIVMQVYATSTTSGAAYITNKSTGQSTSQGFSGQQALCQQGAEWIFEDYSVSGGLIPLSSFSEVTINQATYAGSTTQGAGVDGATVIDISQNGQTLTSASASGDTVQVSYTG